jgi:hypothetical protein
LLCLKVIFNQALNFLEETMKKFVFFSIALLIATGLAVAQESGRSSMQGMMKGEGGRHGNDGDDENDGAVQFDDENRASEPGECSGYSKEKVCERRNHGY